MESFRFNSRNGRGVKINQAACLGPAKSAYRSNVGMLIGGDYASQQDGAASHTARKVGRGRGGISDAATAPEQSEFEAAGLRGVGHFGA